MGTGSYSAGSPRASSCHVSIPEGLNCSVRNLFPAGYGSKRFVILTRERWEQERDIPTAGKKMPELGISCRFLLPSVPKDTKNFKGKLCPAPWSPMEFHLRHHPLPFGSLSPSSSTLSQSLPSPCPTQLLQRPHGARKILGRLRSGGGCEDSLAATGVTVTAPVLAAGPQKSSQPPTR